MSIKLNIVDFETFHRRVTNNEALFIKGERVVLKRYVSENLLNESPAMILYNGIKDLFNNNIIYSDMAAKCRNSNKKNLLFLTEAMNAIRFSDVFMRSHIEARDALALLCLSVKEFNAIRFESFYNLPTIFHISDRYNPYSFVSHPNVMTFHEGGELQTIQRQYFNDNVKMIAGPDDGFKNLQNCIWPLQNSTNGLAEF